MQQVNDAIKTIAFEYHWTPKTISKMLADDIDCNGLWFWYKECERLVKLRSK